ncbi:MAG: RNA polymerase sigma factor [Acidimicrobiia bacterium]
MDRGGGRRGPEERDALCALLDAALPDVYDYLLRRCHRRVIAEDLTSESYLAAIAAFGERPVPLTVAWLIGIARHKLADHWRREAQESRRLAAVAGALGPQAEPGIDAIDTGSADEVLQRLNPMQRAALTLRYVDGLPVPEVASLLGRSVHATETLLVRAKQAYRRHHAAIAGADHG